jgi:glycosyltransferase involved in cell wall biosynthesis
LKVVVSLRQLSTYADRFRVFLELSQCVDRLFLLTDYVDDESRALAQAYTRVELVEIDAQRYAQESTAWLVEHVVNGTGSFVVHSTFGHLVQFFEMYGSVSERTFRLIHSQYTANHDWFNHVRLQDYPMSFKYLGQRVKSYWRDRRMAWNIDGLLVMCEGHKPRVTEAHGLPLSKVFVMPSEVDADFYGITAPQRTTPMRIVFVGACYKNKGLDLILQALPTVLKRFPNLEVELYGNAVKRQTKWLMEALREPDLCGRVIMKNRVKKHRLRQAFHEADLLVSASRFEGSPRAVREAIAAGCPALLSEIAGHVGLDPHQRFIKYVSTPSIESWSAAMIQCLERTDEQWLRAAERGMKAMQMDHHPASVARSLITIYEALF